MIVVLPNTKAGPGHGPRFISTLIDAGARRGIPVSVRHPQTAAETTAMAQAEAAKGHCVVACGGDGTVQAVVSGVAPEGGVLGILPAGRGNDFARAVGIPRTAAGAAQAILQGEERKVDVGSLEAADGAVQLFCTVATCGIDGEVAEATRGGSRLGRLSYLLTGLRLFPRFVPVHLQLRGEWGTFEVDALLAAFGNIATYGGGFPITPTARCVDGMLTVTVVAARGWPRTLALLPRLLCGTHESRPGVHTFRCHRVEVVGPATRAMWADGEPGFPVPVTVAIRPGALRVRSLVGR